MEKNACTFLEVYIASFVYSRLSFGSSLSKHTRKTWIFVSFCKVIVWGFSLALLYWYILGNNSVSSKLNQDYLLFHNTQSVQNCTVFITFCETAMLA